MKTARPYAEMAARAEVVRLLLEPFCERLAIAGSVRRREHLCSDIEVVAAPRMAAGDGLFPDNTEYSLLDRRVDELVADPDCGWQKRLDARGRGAYGSKYKRLTVDGCPVDLFIVRPPAQWGVILLIRTGPAGFSRRMVTPGALGGYLPGDCQVSGGAIYRGEERLNVETEEDWFHLCGMQWLTPERRQR